jgi:hypothetical protein
VKSWRHITIGTALVEISCALGTHMCVLIKGHGHSENEFKLTVCKNPCPGYIPKSHKCIPKTHLHSI